MNDTDIMAIAAHMHVLLRRKTGRVTDTEWMACNADYAKEIVRFARQRAQADQLTELAEWAQRLEQAVQQAANAPVVSTPLLHLGTPLPHSPEAALAAPPPLAPRYVGGIR